MRESPLHIQGHRVTVVSPAPFTGDSEVAGAPGAEWGRGRVRTWSRCPSYLRPQPTAAEEAGNDIRGGERQVFVAAVASTALIIDRW